MLVEKFLGRYMRSRMRKTMTFDPVDPEAAGRAGIPPEPESGSPLLLYLHIPFCEGLCPYCSFHRVVFQPQLAIAYFGALRREMNLYHELGYRFDAVYVGGGTPTLVPDELASVLELARNLWPTIGRLSLETNSNHLTGPRLARLREMGVDRLSVGVQSFQDEILKSIGRYERYGSGVQIAESLRQARGVFPTLNIDLIFNFPVQTDQMLQRDLDTILRLDADQVTFYPLMPGGSVAGRQRRFYALIRESLAATHEPASAWCFSRRDRPGSTARAVDEYIVDHDEYAGLGSGAFGYTGGTLYANTFDIPRYIRLAGRGVLPIAAVRRFLPRERLLYDFLMKLFSGALSVDALERRHGRQALRSLAGEIAFFRAIGALEPRQSAGRHLALTPKGYYVWVILMREFFTGVNNFREYCRDLQEYPQEYEETTL